MLETKEEPDALDVSRLLAGAAKTVAQRALLLARDGGRAPDHSLRPMGRIMRDAGEDEWKIRFLTDGRSRKARDMRRAGEVTVVFQHEPNIAYVTLSGRDRSAR